MLTLLIAQNESEGNLPYGARIDTTLQALGPIGITSLLLQHRAEGRSALTVLFSTGGQLSARAATFEGTDAATATAQANTFLAANSTYLPLFIRDIGSQLTRSLSRDVILLIYSTLGMPNCGQGLGTLAVVRSLGLIAPGATGNVTQVTPTGLSGTYAVVNRSTAAWAAGVDGYAQARSGSCVLDGYPQTCSGVTPPSTTSTSTSSTTSTTSTSTTTTSPPPSNPCVDCVSSGDLTEGTHTATFTSHSSNSVACNWGWVYSVEGDPIQVTYVLTYLIASGVYFFAVDVYDSANFCSVLYRTFTFSGATCSGGLMHGSGVVPLETDGCGGGAAPTVTVSF